MPCSCFCCCFCYVYVGCGVGVGNDKKLVLGLVIDLKYKWIGCWSRHGWASDLSLWIDKNQKSFHLSKSLTLILRIMYKNPLKNKIFKNEVTISSCLFSYKRSLSTPDFSNLKRVVFQVKYDNKKLGFVIDIFYTLFRFLQFLDYLSVQIFFFSKKAVLKKFQLRESLSQFLKKFEEIRAFGS